MLQVAFLWLVGYTFFVFHGLSFHLTPWSQAFINAIVKYTYDRRGQDDATVLLFREENLRHLGVQYPVPWAVHAQILEALASYHPRAVFIDFAFIEARDDVDQLISALCGLGGAIGESRVFFVGPAASTVQKRLEGCGLQPVSPELEDPKGVSGILTYASRSAADGLNTAAFALAATNPALELDEQHRVEPLEIIWGKGVAPLNRKWMKCEEPSLREGIGIMLTEGPLALKMRCPYTRTITVGHLLNFSRDRDVDDALRCRTVLYGAGFQAAGDQVESPVYGRLPAVYLHAMAYDNLVTFGQGYKRAERHGRAARIFDAVLLLIACVILVGCPRRDARAAETFAELKRKMVEALVALTVAGLTLFAIVWLAGLDVGLLAIFVAYVVYRWRVTGDRGFVLVVGLTLATTLFYYYVMNVGPRNILAFLVFFEVVRHVQKHVREAAERYVELRSRERRVPQGVMWRLTDTLVSQYLESVSANGRGEVTHEAQAARTAG